MCHPDKRTLPSKELFADYPEVSLLMDIDVSKKNVGREELASTYNDAQKAQTKLSQNIVNYMFGIQKEKE